MAPPPPAALGAGMVGGGSFSLFPFFKGPACGGPRGRSSGIEFLPSLGTPCCPLLRGGRGHSAAPSPLGAGAPASLRGLSEASRVNCGVFPPGFPSLPGSLCLHRGGGVGALCAECPLFPPRGWSLGSLVEALLGVGVPCGLRGEPPRVKTFLECRLPAREYLLLLSETARLPRRSRGGRGCLGLFLMEASRFEPCR